MKYLLLLANTLIYEYVQKDAYHRLILYIQNINHNFFYTKRIIKVYNGIINFKISNNKKLIKHT